jgi:hypothetical protein
MAIEVQCEIHGKGQETFVCAHLLGDSASLGFNRDEPSVENPFPDAWCDDCELIRAAHDGWNEKTEQLVRISLLCSACYHRARIRNTRTSVTLDDLARLRWKCSSCEEWHYGPCLDYGFSAPYYWRTEYEDHRQDQPFLSSPDEIGGKYFLNEDLCQIEGDFFVRGLIQLAIIGTAKHFCWGVWGSLNRANFETLIEKGDSPDPVDLPPMFSWLSSQISDYPDTLNLKMYARIGKHGQRPTFELDTGGHELAREYHEGITPKRVKRITLGLIGTGG